MKVAIIGAGSWGVWSALELQSRGIEVELFDKWGAGNDFAGSGGYSRIIRMVYGNDRIYSELTHSSFDKWDTLFRFTGENHYKETGVLWMQTVPESKYLEDSQRVLESLGHPLQEFTRDEAKEKWKSINFEGVYKVFYERKAGILDASLACKLALYKFIEEGGKYHNSEVGYVNGKLTYSSGEIIADKYIIAAGSWTRSLLPDILSKITYVSRQEVFFYKGQMKSNENLPIWSDLEADGIFYYGFPPHRGHDFKVAYDAREVEMDPDSEERIMTNSIESKSRKYMEFRFPEMKNALLSEYRVCHYDNSIDGDFIIDYHPENKNILIMTGSSGHGFKMGPAIGQLAADHILEKKPILDKFAIDRFKGQNQRTTQFS